MAAGRRTGTVGRLRAGGVLPMVVGLASALALSGAAVYTVEGVSCDGSAQYVRHAHNVELIGGCVDSAELPDSPGAGDGSLRAGGSAAPAHYRP